MLLLNLATFCKFSYANLKQIETFAFYTEHSAFSCFLVDSCNFVNPNFKTFVTFLFEGKNAFLSVFWQIFESAHERCRRHSFLG